MAAHSTQQAAAPSRRTLLGAFASAPFAVGTIASAAAAPATAQWDRAFAEYTHAEDLSRRYEADEYGDAETAAWRKLMLTPAPHVGALHWKLNYLFGEVPSDGFSESWRYDVVAVTVNDALRLSQGAA